MWTRNTRELLSPGLVLSRAVDCRCLETLGSRRIPVRNPPLFVNTPVFALIIPSVLSLSHTLYIVIPTTWHADINEKSGRNRENYYRVRAFLNQCIYFSHILLLFTFQFFFSHFYRKKKEKPTFFLYFSFILLLFYRKKKENSEWALSSHRRTNTQLLNHLCVKNLYSHCMWIKFYIFIKAYYILSF